MTSARETGSARSSARRRRSGIGRSALRLLAVALGLWLASAALGRLWPMRSGGGGPVPTAGSAGDDRSRIPREPLTVLLIGSDADSLDGVSNGAAPEGPANSDVVLLLRFNPDGPLQVMNLPRELAVQIPGKDEILPLGRLYREGGPALAAGVAGELVGLDRDQPSRYVVMPRRSLRRLVDAVGGVELRLDQTYAYEDETQGLSIDLQAGRQRLNGSQAEHLARYLEAPGQERDRRLRQERLMAALMEELSQAGIATRLPALVASLQPSVNTNLSENESLSLLAAALASGGRVQFSTLPLRPRREAVSMRELAGEPGSDLWKRP
ncbi:LytR family transcriptional regulator [Synechococcus sp. RSCCF101]|uniref:LCP family protein n=1 Tax=Synechococcus sp. RSCCF101 TaxID=2511069 RepID=UPI0012455FDA|nr:LCP family protein [Synechococcus sp. RSCCF101]QEY31129.1 LytR family transcriptional regulator [Synechococcus sp. RSCCF101]